MARIHSELSLPLSSATPTPPGTPGPTFIHPAKVHYAPTLCQPQGLVPRAEVGKAGSSVPPGAPSQRRGARLCADGLGVLQRSRNAPESRPWPPGSHSLSYTIHISLLPLRCPPENPRMPEQQGVGMPFTPAPAATMSLERASNLLRQHSERVTKPE